MDYIIAFIVAFALGFFGMIPPGMITMKLVSISYHKSFKAALLFAFGVSSVEFFQTIFTIHFSKTFGIYFEGNDYIKWGAVLLLLVLAISFFIAKPKSTDSHLNQKELKTINKRTSFFKGVFLSIFNVLKYPFWIAQGIYFSNNGIIQDKSHLIIFSLGSVLGSLLMYYIYIKIGKTILSEFNGLAKNFNKLLAIFFIFLAIVQLFNIYYG